MKLSLGAAIVTMLFLIGCGSHHSGDGGGSANPQPSPSKENAMIKTAASHLGPVHDLLLEKERASGIAPDHYAAVRGWHLYQSLVDPGGIKAATLDSEEGQFLMYTLAGLLSEPTGEWKRTIDVNDIARKLYRAYQKGDN